MRACSRCLTPHAGEGAHCLLDGAPTVERGMDPLEGASLDGLVLEKRVGVGSAGPIFRARHPELPEPLLVQALFGEVSAHPEQIALLSERVRDAGRLEHPALATSVELGATATGFAFLALVMEAGERTLAETLQDGPFAPPRAARILRQLLVGLGEAHRRGLAHGELAPWSVLLSGPPGAEQVRLFGLGLFGPGLRARAPHASSQPASALAPPGPASDLRALGHLASRLLGSAPSATQASVPGLERLLDSLVGRAPEVRFERAAEVIDVLDALFPQHDGPRARPREPSRAAAARPVSSLQGLDAPPAALPRPVSAYSRREAASETETEPHSTADLIHAVIGEAPRLHASRPTPATDDPATCSTGDLIRAARVGPRAQDDEPDVDEPSAFAPVP
jgi:hypothetical protein